MTHQPTRQSTQQPIQQLSHSQVYLLKVLHTLGYAGLIPFVVPVGLLVAERWFEFTALSSLTALSSFGNHTPTHLAAYLLISYSAVILSFMAGTLWALWQSIKDNTAALRAVLISNVLALVAWFAVLLSVFFAQMLVVCLSVLVLGFVSLLWVERRVFVSENNSAIQSQYMRMRLRLSTIVVVLHGLMILMVWEF